MSKTCFTTKLICITKEGYRECCINLYDWSSFFSGQSKFALIIADKSDNYKEENYKYVYEYLEKKQGLMLEILRDYCLKEYNYSRESHIRESTRSNIQEVKDFYPEISVNEIGGIKFSINKIYILPVKNEDNYYTVFDVYICITKEEGMADRNLKLLIMFLKDKFVLAYDRLRPNENPVEELKYIADQDRNGETLLIATSAQMAVDRFNDKMRIPMEQINFSTIFFHGRSIFGKYKELLSYTSCIGLEECVDRNSDCGLPPGSKIIGRLGVDGIFFFIVKRLGIKKEESPIYAVSPMNFDCYIAPVARNLLEFISLGVACKNFGMLECISTSDKVDIEEQLAELDDDPNIKELIAIIQKNFLIIPIDNSYDYVKHIQSDETLKAETKKLQKYILRKLGLDE